MQKSKILTLFFLFSLSICVSPAQGQSSTEMVTLMYDAQCEVIANMKCDRSTESKVFADMKINGVERNDFKASRNLVLNSFRHSSNDAEKKTAAFFDGKDMSSDSEFRFFNDYVKAKYAQFSDATTANVIKPLYGSTNVLAAQLPKKVKRVKITSNSPESVTGGNMWMFSNGIRVIYKQDKKAKDISYTFMFRGGFGSIAGLEPGQGGYVQDLLQLYKIRGMNGAAFRNMLALHGISMNVDVSLMDMRISGYAPSNGLIILMEAMVALSRSREVDPQAYERYLARPRHSTKEAVIDSLFRPNFDYNPYKYEVDLPADLMERAEKEYFSEKFTNFDDGLIIMTGNLSDYQIQTVLEKVLGAFQTEKKYTVYPKLSYQQHSGMQYYEGEGNGSITYAMSMFLSLSSESYLVARLSQIALQNAVRKAFPGKNVSLDFDLEILPYERYSVRVTVDGAGSEDFDTLRRAISTCAEEEISADDMKAYKSQLIGIITEETALESVKTELAISRYTGRKDLLTNYKDKLDKIKADQVADILSAISDGSSVEYVGR